jgi:small subunit ribosomal protein S3
LGQKVHPTGFRIGVIKGWQSRWFAERDYKNILAEDFLIRKLINKELANASVSRIEIERAAASQLSVIIFTARPGIVIGKSGEKVDKLRATLEAKTRKRVRLNIMEIRQPELDALLVARSIAEQLEKRVSFRRAMKQAAQKTMRVNAKGIKIICGGRLGGAEIARSEKEVEGKVPLHTLRADIDYGFTEAHTTFGVIGIKVWIYKGDILPSKRLEPGETPAEAATNFAPREQDTRDRRGGDRRRSGERGPRPQGDQPRGGEGGTRQGGERGSRPQGERSQRPQGDRPRGPRQPRPQGEQQGQPRADRPARPQGERAPRPQGDRPQGDRPRAPRPPRQQQPATPAAEQAPVDQAVPSEPVVQPAVQPETDAGTTQSE